MPDLPPPTPLGLTPYLTIRGGRAEEALAFYARAFGGRELFRNLAQDGKRLLHARVEINGAVVMLSDDFPDMRGGAESPPPAGVVLHLQVDDADAWAHRAAVAGAEIVMPIADMFWGDRYGHLRDPFGHTWSVGSSKKG
ncbi:MAG TPA: glyoxalase/bleomycin resistance/extradiol dioxygenase family protein [Caulobacteraceae bacterium]|nr:glyoxalase/bleomycin resistance/extradiol dioxygenase family protein [Caulobacteraceae bacterium]